jgi:hypothetical protein
MAMWRGTDETVGTACVELVFVMRDLMRKMDCRGMPVRLRSKAYLIELHTAASTGNAHASDPV